MGRGPRLNPDFWANVDVLDVGECWLWQRARNKGYGVLVVNGKDTYAHRHAYAIAKGVIPPGIHVCHTCDNPPCCNPSHLWLGTAADNNHDMIVKGRARRPVLRGQANPASKHTVDQVHAIRAAYAAGGITMKALGAQYGLTESGVHRIVRGSRWKIDG